MATESRRPDEGPRWHGGDWVFKVYVCPECHAQVGADSDGDHICWDHGLVPAVIVTVKADALGILRQLGQVARQTQIPGGA